MSYVYQITFDIPTDQIGQLNLGASVQRAVGYLKALLPAEPGFITARGAYSLIHEDLVHVFFESSWEEWDDLLAHRDQSVFDEHKLLNEFQLQVDLRNLATHVYEEIS